MQTTSKETLVALLATDQFKHLLSQEVSKQLLSSTSSKTSITQQPTKMMQISQLIADISDNLEQIVSFNIKQALEQQYGLLLQENGKMKNDIEDIKQQLLKMSIKNTGKNIIEMKPADLDSDFNDLEEMLDNQSRIGSKQYSKIKKQMDSIKLILLRFTNNSNSILDEIDSSDKKKKLEQRLGKLGKDVNQLLQNSTDGGHLIQTIGIETCIKEIQQIGEKQKKFEISICQKYQTSLKSVWNVITMMEANIQDQRSISDTQSPMSRK